jgi:hypothetical protein
VQLQKQFFTSVILIVAVVLCAANVRSQQANSATENKLDADAALREKAFDLLKSLAGQLGTLQSAENRARIGSNIAGSLWTNDEGRARELFSLVEEDIKAGLRPPAVNDWEDAQTFLVFLQLRADTIARIAKHDPELALAFLKATALSPEIKLQFRLGEKDHQLELQLAKQVASSSPDVALQLARKSLSRGFSFELRPLLSQLHRKHKEHALTLYKEIVQKLGEADLAEDRNASALASDLISSFTPPAADELTFRALAGLFFNTAVAKGCTSQKAPEGHAADICRNIGMMLRQLARVDTARAAQLKQWEPPREYSRHMPLPGPTYYEVRDLVADGNLEEIFSLASQYRDREEMLFIQAVMSAKEMGKFELARKLASDPRLTPAARRVMLARLDEDERRASLNEEKLLEESKRLNAFPEAKDRAMFLMSLANRAGPGEGKTALKLLNQASEIVDSMKSGRAKDDAQLRLAVLYCLQKSDRGLAMMESMVPRLNELVTAAAKLDGYGTRYLREGEWNMTGEGQLGGFLTSMAAQADYFAWCDFDRAVSAAGQFERTEIRMMAQLKLAQGILTGPPKHFRLRMSSY